MKSSTLLDHIESGAIAHHEHAHRWRGFEQTYNGQASVDICDIDQIVETRLARYPNKTQKMAPAVE